MKKLLLTALLFMGIQTTLQAQIYVQAGFAYSNANFTGFKFFTDQKPPLPFDHNIHSIKKESSAGGPVLVFGYEVLDNLNLTMAFRDLGTFTVKGFATPLILHPNPVAHSIHFKQELTAKVTALGLGVNYSFDLTDNLFIAPSLELTSVSLLVKGATSRRFSETISFPKKIYSKTKLVYGFNFGYRVTSAFDVLFTYNNMNFKEMNADEISTGPLCTPRHCSTTQLQTESLNIHTTALSMRYNFGL